MSRLMPILKAPILSNTGSMRVVLTWRNYVVIPTLCMFAAPHKAWSTATTPFEQFLGTILAVALPLLWPVFVSTLSPRSSATYPADALDRAGR